MKDNKSAFNVDEYDEKIAQTLPYYQDFYQTVVDLVSVYFKEEPRWLDVGCGTGKMAEVALANLEVESFLFCDSSSKMIGFVANKFKLSNVDFLNESVENLSFNNDFDIISTIQVNHYLHRDKRIKALENCYRGLKDNGIFITFENYAPVSDAVKELGLARWKKYQLNHGRNIHEVQNHLNRYGQDYFPITINEHLKLMKDCGFKVVEIIWLSYLQVGFLAIK